MDGHNPYPSNYRGCTNVKDKMQRRNILQQDDNGKKVSSNFVIAGQSFVTALCSKTEQQSEKGTLEQQQTWVDKAGILPPRRQQQENKQPGHSAQAKNVNRLSLNHTFKLATVVQKIMRELSAAVAEEDKIMANTNIIINLMKQSGH